MLSDMLYEGLARHMTVPHCCAMAQNHNLDSLPVVPPHFDQYGKRKLLKEQNFY